MARVTLTVTLDAAPVPPLATAYEWRLWLQQQLADLAGHYRPVVSVDVPGGVTVRCGECQRIGVSA